MTNNHPELCGVEQQLKNLLYEYNMATREGTLKQMANRLKLIGDVATQAEAVATKLIFPPPPPPAPEEDE
jgi:hypothetical protein